MEKIIVKKQLLAIFAISFSFILVAYHLVSPWKLDVKNDVAMYYEARVSLEEGNSISDLIVSPFFYKKTWKGILAPSTKPVYMAALNVWAAVHDFLNPKDQQWPNRRVFFGFTLFTLWALFLTICLFGFYLGYSKEGILCAVFSLLGPWSLIYLYYPAYTQLSMVFFLITILLSLSHKYKWLFLSGLFSAITLLTNSSMIVYLFGVGLLIIFSSFPRWKLSLARIGMFAAGFFFLFVVFEGIFPFYREPDGSVLSPLTTLFEYFTRSANANHFIIRGHPGVPKYPGLFFLIVKQQSPVLFLIVVFLLTSFVFKFIRLGWKECTGNPKFKLILTVGFPAVIGILLIELLPSVQLGRSYFIGYPLLIFCGILFFRYLMQNYTPPMKKFFYLFFIFILSFSQIYALTKQRFAFHGAEKFLREASHPVGMLMRDIHASDVTNLAKEDRSNNIVMLFNFWDVQRLFEGGNREAYLLYSPQIETVMINSLFSPLKKIKPGNYVINENVSIKIGDPLKVPFYGLYPLLVFEDEFDTWRFISREFNNKDWSHGRGALEVYPLTQLPFIPTGVETTFKNSANNLIGNTRSPFSIGSFPTHLILDKERKDTKAWHGKLVENDHFPQWIDVDFVRPVYIEKLALQSQYGGENNLKRAPHTVVIQARENGKVIDLETLQFQFSNNGQWILKDLSHKNRKLYQNYRLSFLDNHGSVDYLSIQAAEFIGQGGDLGRYLKTVNASSVAYKLGSDRLIDNIPIDSHAWHGEPNFPQWINVVFKKSVMLQKLGIQSQLGNPSNIKRAPKDVIVYAGEDKNSLEEVSRWSHFFTSNGEWGIHKLSGLDKPYSFYRLKILGNHGAGECVSIQELKFYGQVVNN